MKVSIPAPQQRSPSAVKRPVFRWYLHDKDVIIPCEGVVNSGAMMTDLDYPDCSINEMLRESVRRFASHRAIVFNDQILDFAAFDDQSDRVAKGLIRQLLDAIAERKENEAEAEA